MDSTGISSSLYSYIYDGLYSKYKLNRQVELEKKWTRNYNAYHKIDNDDDTWKVGEGDDWRSNTYIDITKQKITSGAHLVSDMLFKNSTIPFMLEDPLDEQLIPRQSDYEMESLIKQQFMRSDANEAFKEMILDGAIYGEGYCRFYIDEKRKIVYNETETGFERIYENFEELKVARVSIWNIFRDIEVPLAKSEGVIERSYVMRPDLHEMYGEEFVVEKGLKKALSGESEDHGYNEIDDNSVPSLRNLSQKTRNIELLECWCRVPLKLAKSFENNNNIEELETNDYDEMIYVKAVLCNGQIIKYVRIDQIDIPYYSFIWERNNDGFGGIGVADNVGAFQPVLNGAFRAYEDNKKISGNVMFAGRSGYIKNLDKGFVPGKFLEITGELDTIREAVEQFTVQDVGESLLSMINTTMMMADMSSNIPRASQGQESSNPQTAYEIQQRLERAGKYIGQVITNADKVIEDVAERFYDYNMLDDNIPKEIKIPYKVKAIGFASYEARMIRSQKLMQTLQLFSQNEVLHANYKMDYLVKEILESNDINPKLLLKSQEEKQQEAEQQAQAQQAQQEMLGLEKEKQEAEIDKIVAQTQEILNEMHEATAEGVRKDIEFDANGKDEQGVGQKK